MIKLPKPKGTRKSNGINREGELASENTEKHAAGRSGEQTEDVVEIKAPNQWMLITKQEDEDGDDLVTAII